MSKSSWPHLMLDCYGCDPVKLNDAELVMKFLTELPKEVDMQALGTPVVHEVTADVHPDTGITGVVVITTSHISIHTFPNGQAGTVEEPFMVFDCFSCKPFSDKKILSMVQRFFSPSKVVKHFKDRLNG